MIIDTKKLLNMGLISEKISEQYPDLRVYKYKKKVFYNNLWNSHKDLVECRGLVKDSRGNIVVLPFRKVYNYQENGTTINKSSVVKRVEKINGFFAACSLYQGEVLVSTTGSLDSDFVKMAKEKINLEAAKEILISMEVEMGMKGTLMFEIAHEDDPHIIEEEFGAYIIGYRVHNSGMLMPEEVLDRMAGAANHVHGENTFLRPKHTYCTFKQVLRDIKDCKHEGFMVYKKDSDKSLKLKSPHYLSKKFLMRMGDAKIRQMFHNKEDFKKTIDEEFYEVVDFITCKYEPTSWFQMKDQERREVIENYFGG